MRPVIWSHGVHLGSAGCIGAAQSVLRPSRRAIVGHLSASKFTAAGIAAGITGTLLPMTTPDAPDGAILLTVAQTAGLLQLSEDTIRRHISSGELKSLDASAGRRSTTRIRRTAIDAFIAGREKKRAKVTDR